MPEFTIADRRVGPEEPPLVIAEVGINHEGDFGKAAALVDAAADAGAELVKFQCHITDKEMVPTDMTPGGISRERLWDIIDRCALSEEEERGLQQRCRERGVIYLSTPFSREAADRLHAMDVPAFKIGSGECNNLPLLDHVASKGRPIVLSTGMNDLQAVARAVAVIQEHRVPLALLHCTSMYPAPYAKVRLGALTALRERFPGVPVGLSDHSRGIYTCLGAVALGACVLEKHFTISREWPGPDTGISIEPPELRDLIRGARAVWEARGGAKDVLPEEKPVIEFAYATVVSLRPIARGETFTRENTWVKRPGTGPIPAADLDRVLGRRALRDVAPHTHVEPADVEGPIA